MTPTCKTCIHYKPNNPALTDPDAGRCHSDKFVYNTEITPKDGLQYWDYEGYAAGFTVGPDFGCIHHKEVANV